MDEKLFNRLKRHLVIDIETASAHADFSSLPEGSRQLWERKVAALTDSEDPEPLTTLSHLYRKKAALYAEFGRVILIGLGYFALDAEKRLCLRVKTLVSPDERTLLAALAAILRKPRFSGADLRLVSHNGKAFDWPYLCRRMLVHGLAIPEPLQLWKKKPWEILHIDTMEIWRFGDRRSFVSLASLGTVLGITYPTPDTSDHSHIHQLFHEQNDLEAIAQICARDVALTAQVYLRLSGKAPLEAERIVFVDEE